MGILGDLLYPNNAQMARDLNNKEDKLRKQNNLHNDLVNAYRDIGEKTKTFDAYLMALMVMQYHLAFVKEDLSDLPDTNLPKISQSILDTIESIVIDGLIIYTTAGMVVNFVKAATKGISNVVRMSGIFARTAPEGELVLSEALGGGIEIISLQTPLLNSGSVGALTTESSAEAGELSSELAELSGSVTEVFESIDLGSLSVEAEEARAAAQVGKAVAGVAEAAEAAEASEASVGFSFSAVLGPLLFVFIVVNEILGTIRAGQTKDKLKDAEDKMDKLLRDSEDEIKRLKDVFKSLLTVAKKDIDAYNRLLPDIYAISQEDALNRHPFNTKGIDKFINSMEGITIDQNGTEGYTTAACINLDDAQQFISVHARSLSQTTEIVSQIKTYMAKNNLTDLQDDDPLLTKIAKVNSISLEVVQAYNGYRRNIVSVAAMLEPYHQQVIENTPLDAKSAKPPETVNIGNADKNFVPKPDKFKIPTRRSQTRNPASLIHPLDRSTASQVDIPSAPQHCGGSPIISNFDRRTTLWA
ncbi:MAG: hypothetical protein ACFKPT_25205 [Gloeotrichia echinulata GP01]